MKTFEYRLRPNKAQEQALMSVLIASRKMYNACLEELITHYQQTGKYLHLYEQDKRHGKQAHPALPAVVVDTTVKHPRIECGGFDAVPSMEHTHRGLRGALPAPSVRCRPTKRLVGSRLDALTGTPNIWYVHAFTHGNDLPWNPQTRLSCQYAKNYSDILFERSKSGNETTPPITLQKERRLTPT
jgi:Helix-turn-helix domain